MFFFRSKGRIMVERHGKQQELVAARGEDANYVTSMYDFIELRSSLASKEARRALSRVSEEAWFAGHEAPKELGISNRGEFARKKAEEEGHPRPPMPFRALDNQMKAFKGKDSIKLAVINGFGIGVGDNLVGMTAFRDVRNRLAAAGFKDAHVELWVRPGGYDNAVAVSEMHGGIDKVGLLPMPIEQFKRLDGFWDLGGLVDRPAVTQKCTVDFFLELLGVDPSGVTRDEKRNRLSLSIPVVKEVGDATRELTGKYVILHPLSRNIRRNMPADIFRELCARLVKATGMDVASVVPVPKAHERHVDLSAISARSFAHYCTVVKNASALVSVDTSIYHVGDAFSVPSVVIFSTVMPELRARYYPNVEGIPLPGLGKVDPLKLWSRLDLDYVVQTLVERLPLA
jgi:hypothetical protein